MENNSKIPIQNIYYMLSYAYQTLGLSEYQRMDVEQFRNVKHLYIEILKIGLPVLIRGGLIKDYIRESDKTTVIKGKIDINTSIKRNALVDKKLVVLYDEFSEDVLLNQILKATVDYLSKSPDISKEYRRFFFGLLPYFAEVTEVELNLVIWKKVRYNRQNIRYQFLIDVCRYLYEELLLDESSAEHWLRQVEDEQRLSSLYEKFVFAFYKRETDYIVTHPQIPWIAGNGFTDALPIMQTDIVLSDGAKTLIVDTKFYSENMATKFVGGNAKQKTANLYQIFTYVNNWIPKDGEIIGGMLLYAKTTGEQQPDHYYNLSGNSISIVTLDLQQDFVSIKEELLNHASRFFKP